MKLTMTDQITAAITQRLLAMRVFPQASYAEGAGVDFTTVVFSGGYTGTPDLIYTFAVEPTDTPTTSCTVEGIAVTNGGPAVNLGNGLLAAFTWSGSIASGVLTLDYSDEDDQKINIFRVSPLTKTAFASEVFPHAILGPPDNVYNPGPHGYHSIEQRRVIEWWSDFTTDDVTLIPKICNQAIAQIKRAIMPGEDELLDTTLGGIVIDVTPTDDNTFTYDDQRNCFGIDLGLLITFQEAIDNPLS